MRWSAATRPCLCVSLAEPGKQGRLPGLGVMASRSMPPHAGGHSREGERRRTVRFSRVRCTASRRGMPRRSRASYPTTFPPLQQDPGPTPSVAPRMPPRQLSPSSSVSRAAAPTPRRPSGTSARPSTRSMRTSHPCSGCISRTHGPLPRSRRPGTRGAHAAISSSSRPS